MTRLRFTLAQLTAVVLYMGFGFAALRNATEFSASAAYTLAILSIAAALVGASACGGWARSPWVGFAVFGWTYLLTVHRDWKISDHPRFTVVPKPPLLIEWGAMSLQPHLKPQPAGMSPEATYAFFRTYEQVSQSPGIILFGLIGAALGRLLAAKAERSRHSTSAA